MPIAPADIIHFDDSKAELEAIEGVYYRWTLDDRDKMTVSCPCNLCSWLTPSQNISKGCKKNCHGLYRPNYDIQRYCTQCITWYHIGCCTGMKGALPTLQQVLGEDQSPPLEEKGRRLLMVPIERGGLFGLVGNGQIQLAIRQTWWRKKEVWEEVDLVYQELVEKTIFSYVLCPLCFRPI